MSEWQNKLRAAISHAVRSKSGSVLPIFAVSIMGLFGTMGMAVDFGLAFSQRGQLQKAADAAALSAALLLDAPASDRKARGKAVFSANYTAANDAQFSIDVEDNGSDQTSYITASATRALKTHILPLFGYPTIDLKADVRSPIPRLLEVEVVMVLDYSDSMMTNQKYVRMKDAAVQLVDTLSMNGNNKRAKFGIVPFAAMVKANLPSWAIRSDVTYSGCTQDRRSPFNTQEDGPTVSDDSKWGEVTSTHTCSDMGTRGLDVVNLSNHHDTIKSKITAMQPYLWTHIALGAEFGWQMLSPTGVFGSAAAYNPDKTIKVAIILTDGMQTAPGWDSTGAQSTAAAEANLTALCTGMKAKNIKVFTVGYDLTDTHTLDLLKNCAGAGMFYDANDIQSGLVSAFSEIGERVREQMVRLSE